MSKQVITNVKLPDDSQILAERIAARMPVLEPASYDSKVMMWGKYIDLELAKDSIRNYTSRYDNLRVCSVGSRDLSFSEIHTTAEESVLLYRIACEQKFAIVVASTIDAADIFLSNLAEPANTSKEQILSHLRAWDEGWT